MKSHSQRGKRNRQRGAELQRQIVRLAKDKKLDAHNRDRGGAQHEMGDVEIDGKYYGCKRRKKIAQWLKPEKKEVGVFVREDFGKSFVVLDAEHFISLLSLNKKLQKLYNEISINKLK